MQLEVLNHLQNVRHQKSKKYIDYANIDLLPFVVDTHKMMFNEKFIVKSFHEEMAELLTRCAKRELDNYILIINMPPRFSKTQFISYYIMWCFLKNEMAKFIYATYSHTLSLKCSREIKKGLIQFHNKKAAFSKDSAELWETKAGGGLYATSMGGAVTGFGAGDLFASPYSGDLIIDDSMKASDCFSESMRNNLIENFSNTFWSRRNNLDRIPIINIQQRLHVKDLSGWIMNDSNYPYTAYKIKALDENDEPTFPERVSKETLLELKAASPHTFSAQQQQEPTSFSGNFFLREWFEVLDILPGGWIKEVRYWDRASTLPNAGNLDPDWTRGLKMLKYPNGIWIVADLKSLRDTPLKIETLIKNTASQDGYETIIYGEQDPGSAGTSDIGYFTRNLAGYMVQITKPSENKEVRARGVAAQCQAGNIKILRSSWNEDFFSELENFPNGAHDDIVDTLSGAFNALCENTSVLDSY